MDANMTVPSKGARPAPSASMTKRMRCKAAVGVAWMMIVVATAAGQCFAQNRSQSTPLPCPGPALGLSQGAPDTNVELVPFVYGSRTFQMEIASAFAARTGATYCLRYEAENVTPLSTPPGKERVDLFYWPLASLMIEHFEAGKYSRSSLLRTLPSVHSPVLGPTDLSAFNGAPFSTTAYKVSLNTLLTRDVVRASFGDREIVPPPTPKRRDQPAIAQQQGSGLTFERAPHPIGAVWETPAGELAVTTDLDPTRPNRSIIITIERRNYKNPGPIFAPFAQALEIASEPKQIVPLINELRQKDIRMIDNVARFGSGGFVDLRASETRLFLVEQPIVFLKEDGSRVCFLAPTYSPVDINPSLLSCDPKALR